MDSKPIRQPNLGNLADQSRDAAIKALEVAITEGLESGPSVSFDVSEFNKEMRRRYQKAINARGS